VERDFYPTPAWVVEALAEHVKIAGKRVWEPACGDGRVAEALKTLGAASVHASDIADYGYPESRRLDFLAAAAAPADIDLIATNPPFGVQGKLAVKFAEAGLRLIADRGTLHLGAGSLGTGSLGTR
jgi:predicted RNA methylase